MAQFKWDYKMMISLAINYQKNMVPLRNTRGRNLPISPSISHPIFSLYYQICYSVIELNIQILGHATHVYKTETMNVLKLDLIHWPSSRQGSNLDPCLEAGCTLKP